MQLDWMQSGKNLMKLAGHFLMLLAGHETY
jgi:hypothetical protein